MNNLRKIFWLLLFVLYFQPTPKVFALHVVSHQKINEFISMNTVKGFSLDAYLKNQLGFQEGVDKKFDKKKVYKWLEKGGEYEDEPPWTIPYLRSVNHFHYIAGREIMTIGRDGGGNSTSWN